MKCQNNKTIAVVGLGYVGLPLALLSDKKGYKVIGIDVSADKINLLNKHVVPFDDKETAEQLKKSSLEATTNFSKIKDASVVIICVPTPVYENHMPNLEPVKSACKNIAPYLQKNQLIVLESTVNPGVCEEIVLPLLEKETGLKCGKDFFLAHCPERINPGDKEWNVSNIPRVVGGFCETSLEKAAKFYRSIISAEIKQMSSLKEAEAVKIVENSFRNVNIAFVNELAISFGKLGIDVVNVIDGAATKPFSFMPHYPGCGIGGHCIPVDPYYLIDYVKKNNGFNHEFLTLACKTNEKMPEYTVDLAEEELKRKNIAIKGTKVTVLGLAYKADIDDCRESPAFEIIKVLQKREADVATYDPYVLNESTAKKMDEAVDGAKVVIVATAHKIFSKISPAYLLKNGVLILIDGRNFLPKEKFIKVGVVYRGIGR